MRFIRKPSLPSPAMIVALVALFLALGGSAYALTITGANIRNGSITAKDVRNRSLKGTKFMLNSIGGNAIKPSALKSDTFPGRILQDNSVTDNQIDESTLGPVPQSTGVQFQAVVNAQGQLVNGRGVAGNGVARTGQGSYQVTFQRPVGACAVSATLANSTGGPAPIGLIGAGMTAANGNAVLISTANPAGQPTPEAFHLILSC